MTETTNASPRPAPWGLLWLDLETTGLEPREDGILEIAYHLTDFEYPYAPKSVSQYRGHYLVQSPFARAVADDNLANRVVQEMHDKSGLAARIREHYLEERADATARAEGIAFRPRYTLTAPTTIEADLLTLSQDWPLEDKDARVVLAGNSVHFDLGFLRVHFPAFARRLSYRVFDVSSTLMFCRSLGMPAPPKVEPAHRAMEDVEHSMRTAKACAEWMRVHGPRSPVSDPEREKA